MTKRNTKLCQDQKYKVVIICLLLLFAWLTSNYIHSNNIEKQYNYMIEHSLDWRFNQTNYFNFTCSDLKESIVLINDSGIYCDYKGVTLYEETIKIMEAK